MLDGNASCTHSECMATLARVGMTGSRPFASSSDGRALCPTCGQPCPADAMMCPSCGDEVGGETVLDDSNRGDTSSLGAGRTSAMTSHSDTTPNGNALTSATRIEVSVPSESGLPSFAERTDEHLTSPVARMPNVAGPAP